MFVARNTGLRQC